MLSAPFYSWEVTTKGHNPFSLSGEKFCCSLLCSLLGAFSWIPHFPPCHCIQGTLLRGLTQQKVILRRGYLIFVMNDVGVLVCAIEQGDRWHCHRKSIPPLFFCSSTWPRWTGRYNSSLSWKAHWWISKHFS